MDVIKVSGVSATRCGNAKYTSGMVGAQIEILYGEDWALYNKTVCFSNGVTQRDDVSGDSILVIPHEVLEVPGKEFKMGFYGTKDDNQVTPTIWVSIATILPGTDPSGDVSTDPSLPVYSQILEKIGQLNSLETECKNNLVCAINELFESGGSGGSINVNAVKRLIEEHNVSTDAHNDIRLQIKSLSDKLNAFLDVDNPTLDQLSELIQAIKQGSSDIEKLTNGKINTTDIVNDLITNVSDKPLSAAQGVVLKALIDAIDIPEVPSWAMQPTKPKYTADEVGAVADSDLQSAVDKALAEAKQSGLFDGQDGMTPKFVDVVVSTLDPGSKATASITGPTESLVLKLGIPRGRDGKDAAPLKPLTFTGASTAEYDGTKPVTVDIPNGISLPGAQVGDLARVKAIGPDGQPSEWEPVTAVELDGAWELIEPIVVGYERLLTRPDDWAENHANYYMLDFASAQMMVHPAPSYFVPSQFYFKKSVNFEPVSAISRSARPDGAPYHEKALRVNITRQAQNENYSSHVSVGNMDTAIYPDKAGTWNSYMHSFTMDHGFVVGEVAHFTSLAGVPVNKPYALGNFRKPHPFPFEGITCYAYPSYTEFLQGDVIMIYGVKA